MPGSIFSMFKNGIINMSINILPTPYCQTLGLFPFFHYFKQCLVNFFRKNCLYISIKTSLGESPQFNYWVKCFWCNLKLIILKCILYIYRIWCILFSFSLTCEKWCFIICFTLLLRNVLFLFIVFVLSFVNRLQCNF